MPNRDKILFFLMTISLVLTVWTSPALAGYYDGKTITVIANSNPGSGLDLNCRFFAQHWEKHFPGKTKLIVKNMGGGSKALNFVYEKARPDGMTIYYGGFNPMGVLTNAPGIRYKVEELKFIGGANGFFFSLARTDTCSNPSDILKAKKMVVGGINPAITLDIISQLSLDMLGADYRYVTGFRGMPKLKTALLSDEIQFTTSGYAGYRNFFRDTSLKSGELTMMWYHPMKDEKGNPAGPNPFPGTRPFIEVYKELTGKELSGTLAEAYEYMTDLIFRLINNVFTPPGTPAEAVAELRDTFKSTINDEAFQKAWEEQYDTRFMWIDGETGQKKVNTYRQVSQEVVDLFVKYKLQQ